MANVMLLSKCKRVKITLSRSDSRGQSLLELNFTLLRVKFVYDYSSSMNCHSHKSENLTAFTLKRGKFNSNKDWPLESLLERVIFTLLH